MLNVLSKIKYRYVVAIIYACVIFLDRLDLTIVNIALPTLADYFKIPITQTEWITNGFLLALAISIPISGWLGDCFGPKRVFTFATFLFGFTSFLCAFSPNLWTMVVLRFLQGLSGGVIIPVGMAMVYRVFDKSEYVSITSYIFLPTLIAPALAPALGGFIIHVSSWKWIFLFAAPVCLIAVVLSILILKEQIIEDTAPLDWGGFIFSSSFLIFALYFISSLGKSGLSHQTVMALFLSFLFLVLFVKHERNARNPLINLDYFKNKLFLQANLIQIAFQICHFGSIFLVGMYLQVSVGMSAMLSGFIMGMQALGAICTSRYSVRLYYSYGPGLPIIVGFVGVAFFTLCILLIKTPTMIFEGAVVLFLRGIFSGLCGTPIQTSSIIGFDKKEVSRTSAVFNAGRQVSISLGVALSSLLIAYGFKVNQVSLYQTAVPSGVFVYAFMLIPIVAFLGIIIALTMNNKEIVQLSSERSV